MNASLYASDADHARDRGGWGGALDGRSLAYLMHPMGSHVEVNVSKRDEYQHHMEEELALWSARFDALKTLAGKDAKAEIAAQLERWNQARATAAVKLAELERTLNAFAAAFGITKDGLQKIAQSLRALAAVEEPRSTP
jgi:hypothetical protein